MKAVGINGSSRKDGNTAMIMRVVLEQMEKEGLCAGTTTWTYMIDERASQFSRIPYLVNSVSNQVKGAVFTVRSLFEKIRKQKNP